jgi:anaerobic selenocysteine-containing dehydrogenase
MSTPERRTVRTMCPMNCHPTFCGQQVTLEGDRVVEIRGDKDNPDSQGFLCVRGQASREIIGNPRRLLHPLVRDARTEAFRRANWDEALARITAAIEASGRDRTGLWLGHGTLTNDYGSFAHVQLALRLANMAGLQGWDGSMICWGLGGFGAALTGVTEVHTKEDMGAHADLVVLWGANLASQPNTGRHVSAAKRRGARILAIDVRESEACRVAHEHFIIRPGTDAALALALMHVIVAENLHDPAFIAAHTLGFEDLRAHLARCTPQWAAEVTGIDATRIGALARRYATTARAMILMGGSSMYKDANGWQASRAITCLPAVTGKIGKPGTGLGPRHAGDPHGMGLNPIVNFEARPPAQYIPDQMSAIIEAVESGRLRTLLLFGTNMLSSFADANRLARGFEHMDLIVAQDLFMNATAERYAHVVLPGTAWLEDIGVKATATHLYLMDRMLAPEGEARSLVAVLRALGERLGVDGLYPWNDETGHIDAVLDHPATGHMTVARLRECGGIAPLEVSHVAHPAHDYPTPSGKIEFVSAQARACGLPALPTWTPRAAPGLALELRSGRTLSHFHAFYDHGRALPGLARLPDQATLWISPADAAARGLKDGDPIRIHNDRGRCDARAEVTARVPPGTVWMHDGVEGLNTLTAGAASLPDAATRLFRFTVGQSGFDARVEVDAQG